MDREILRLAVPATAALAADPLLSLVDTALVGRLGAASLAALGIDTAVFTTVFFGFNFLTYGTTAAVARRRGAGDDSGATRYAVQALWLAVTLGLVMTVVLVGAAPWIVRVMGARAEVAEQAAIYLRIRGAAAVAVLIVQVGHGAFRGRKDTATPLKIALLANVVNGVVSWVLIYPVGWGIAGAAAGTVVAEVGSAAAFLFLGARRFAPASLRIDRRAMTEIVRVSRDLFLRTLSLLTGLLVTTAVAARMGTVVVAGHQIARELWTMLALVLDGFAIAGQAMIATSLGARDSALARRQAGRLVAWGAAGGLLLGMIYLPLGGVLPGVFTTDGAVLREVRSVWVIIAMLQPVGGIVFVLDGVLMGAGDFRFLLASTAAAALAVLAPLGIVALLLDWGLVGVWLAMAAMMAVRLGTMVWRWRSGRWAGADGAAEAPVSTTVVP